MKRSEKLHNLFGTSRMMLFEHRDALVERHRKRSADMHKPEWDEQRLEEINMRLQEAYREQQAVGLLLFDPAGSRTVSGVVSALDPGRRRIRIDDTWLAADTIIDVLPR